MFYYLSQMQNDCIYYRGDAQDLSLFVCASDAFFDNNILDQKSFLGYIIKLFSKSVMWKANKQDTVTILFIKTELLAILEIAKKAIYFSWLMQVLNFCYSGSAQHWMQEYIDNSTLSWQFHKTADQALAY